MLATRVKMQLRQPLSQIGSQSLQAKSGHSNRKGGKLSLAEAFNTNHSVDLVFKDRDNIEQRMKIRFCLIFYKKKNHRLKKSFATEQQSLINLIIQKH